MPAVKQLAAVIAAGVLLFTSSQARAADEAPEPIGIIIPLTGEFAAWAAGMQRAFQMLAPEYQGRFSFHFEDEGNCEPAKAVSAFRKLIATDVHFFFLGCLAGTKAVLPIAEQHDVLLMSLGLVDDATFAQTTKLVNLATQLSTESEHLGRHVLRRNVKRAAVVHWEDAFSNEFAATLGRRLEAGGVSIADFPVGSGDKDFRSTLLRLRAGQPDVVCANVGEQQSGLFMQQLRQMGITVPVFSNYAFESEPTLSIGREFVEGVEYTFPANSAEGSAAKQQFDARFAKMFGSDKKPSPNAYFARDGLVLLQEALTRCLSAAERPGCVSKFLKSGREFNGLSGTFSFRQDGSNIRPYGVKKIEHGKFIWLIPNLNL